MKWIDGLPRGEVKAILKQLLECKGQQAEENTQEPIRGVAAWLEGRQDRSAPAHGGRTAGECREG